MPPLTKEALRRISSGEDSTTSKFVSIRIKGVLSADNIPPTRVIFVAPSEIEHTNIFEEYRNALYSGALTISNDVEDDAFDAGRIKRKPNGVVVFYDHSSGMGLGKNFTAREETGIFARDEVGKGEVPVEWEIR